MDVICKAELFYPDTQTCEDECLWENDYTCCALCDKKADCEYFCGECEK